MNVYRYEEISARLEKDILEERYQPGTKLPSVRLLKTQYNCSVSTVQKAYDQLMAKGLVESVPKSGYYVVVRAKTTVQKAFVKGGRIQVRDAVFESNLALVTAYRERKHNLSAFHVAAPGDLLVPQKLLLRTMQAVIRSEGTSLLRYYPSNGAEALKSAIVKRAALYHTNLDTAELIVTDGALQALYIALASVTTTGSVVAVESPCVFSVLEVLRVLKLRIIEIPVHPIDGFAVDVLEKAVAVTPVHAIVLSPNFHNPTGTTLSDKQKQRLLAIAIARQIPIVENDVYGDLNFSGSRPRNIRSWDETGLVMTYTSYSKTLAPGIRLGWLAAGRFFKEAEQLKYALGSTVAPIFQETLCCLLATNSYERHVHQLRKKLALQYYQTRQLLDDFFPEGTMTTEAKGGYSIWVKMPENIDMNLFYEGCTRVGIRFTPGYTFSFSNTYRQYVRIVFADIYTTQRKEAFKKIGDISRMLNR